MIGKGGKVIQDICACLHLALIDVQEDGHVFVSAVDQEDAKRAIFTIKTIVEDPEIGAIYKGKVTRLMNFGAFVEIAPGKGRSGAHLQTGHQAWGAWRMWSPWAMPSWSRSRTSTSRAAST